MLRGSGDTYRTCLLDSDENARENRMLGNGSSARAQFKSLFEALEERVLFDAVPDAGIVQPDVDAESGMPAQTQQVSDISAVPRELVLIDPSVEDAETLLSEILQSKSDSTIEIHILDPNREGVGQITELLENSGQQYDAIHIISHGNDGQVQLGGSVLNADNLLRRASQLASWSQALTADADLLFYGCNLASSESGQEFLESISAITGADVAASDDLTGSENQGGNWDLEFAVGALETNVITAHNWQGILNGAPVPTATLDIPDEEFINENFDFIVSFDNTSGNPADVGYAPFIDLSVPDGINLNSATFLNSPITLTNVGEFNASGDLVDAMGSPVTHPMTGLPVTGTPGETFYVLEVPFGSFVPDQPIADITISAELDSADGAVVGSPLDIDATGGFALGADPLDNDLTDPPIIGATVTDSVTPTVIDLIKSNDAEDGIERATGPNYPVQFSLTIDIADGETITALDIIDSLPNSYVYIANSLTIDSSNATAATAPVISDVPTSGTPQNAPDNNFLIEFGSVTGSSSDSDIVVRYHVWIDENDANGDPVIDPISGDQTEAINDSSVTGNYEGTSVGDDAPETNSRIEQSSLAAQKDVAIVIDTGGAGATPGDTLEYTIDVQISDFFEFSNLVLDDTFTDGQTFDASFTPTFVITEGGTTTSGSFAASNFTVTPAASGATNVLFDIASEVPDGTLTGDLFADPTISGSTTVTVKFRTIIQDEFSTNFPSGDESVDIGDVLSNSVTAQGQLPSGQFATDADSVSIEIAGPTVTKELYAIDNVLLIPGTEVVAGITTTYRLQVVLPTSDVENLVLTDYLPLPLYNASEVTSFDLSIAGGIPPAGVATFGPSHTLDMVLPGPATGPFITVDGVANTVEFDFGSFDNPANLPSVVDILFTVTGQDVLMADGLTLNNQVLASYGSTNNGAINSAALAPVVVAAPELSLTKGIVATTAADPTFTSAVGPVAFNAPGSASSFAGGINSTNLANSPIDSDLQNADAGDLVTFAIVIENSGGAEGYDLLIQDTIPGEFLTPPGGLNLQIRDGDGNLLTHAGAAGDLFTTGLEINDPTPSTGAIGSFDDADAAGDGSNIIVITYDLQLSTAISADTVYTNTAELAEYGALNGGADHTAGSSNSNWIDTATIDTPTLVGTKSIVATSEAHTGVVSGVERVTIGEIIRYRLVTELPEVTVENLILLDFLPAGLQFLDDGTSTVAFVHNGGGITSTDIGTLSVNVGAGASVVGNETNLGGVTPSYTLGDNNIGSTISVNSNTDNFNSGTNVFFKLGSVTNADNDADKEFVVVEFNALVLNADGSNDNTDRRRNRFRIQDGTTNFEESNQTDTRIAEPSITNVRKTATPTSGDAGDVVDFEITFSNSASMFRSDAFDINVLDVLPPEYALVAGSVVITPADGTTGITNNTAGNTIDIDIDQMPIGGEITIQYQATLLTSVEAGEVIFNVAEVTYTSLPGTGTVNNPTGSTTPGGSGADNGERDGSSPGAHNDFSDSDDAQVTIDVPVVAKSLISTSIDNASNALNEAVIGETAVYEVTITVPEGTTRSAQLIDILDSGLSFVSLDSITTSAGVVSSTVNLNDATTITPGTSGQQVTFDLGDITNSNSTNAAAETITLRYTVLVENVVSNQAGSTLDNSVQFGWLLGGTTLQLSNSDDAEDIAVIEPNLVVNKDVSAPVVDANDSVTFNITISHSGASTDAFDVTFTDPVPSQISWNIADITAVHTSLGDISGLFQQTGNTLETIPGASFDILDGETVTITVTGTISQSVTPGQELSNTATADWSSLDGNDPNERDGDDGIGGALDDYQHDSTASVTVIGSPTITKDIVGTSINDANNDDSEVVIGETIQYRLRVSLPESTIPGSHFLDNLDLGLEFVSLDSVTAYSGATVNPATINSSVGGFANTALFAPTIVGDGATAAQSLEFDFGTITNSDTDNATAEAIEILYTVRVNNIPSNTGNGAATGQLLNNTATFFWEDVSANPFMTASVDAPAVEVIEPELSITKQVNDDTPHLGQTINYTITIEHTSDSDADAHNIALTDLVPTGLTLDLASVNVVGANVVTDTTAGNAINFVLDELAVGDSITLTYSATVTTDATQIGINLDNTAETTWSSLPDGNVSGSAIERDGDGGNAGEDDYVDSIVETAVLTHPQVELDKEIVDVSPASSAIDGNFDLTYDLTITSTGNDPLTQVSLIENLRAQYGNAFVGLVSQGGLSASIVGSTATDTPELNTNYNGDTDAEIFDNTGSNTASIETGQLVTVRIIIEVDPNAAGAITTNGDLINQATVTATGDDTGVVITDLSDDPNNPADADPNMDGNPDDPNPIRLPNISLQKTVATPPVPASSATAGNFDVTYELVITNTGSTALDTLILNENLQAHFGGAFVGIVPQTGGLPAVITATTAADAPGINTNFDGTAANQNIFDGTSSSLLVNQSVTVEITVELDPDNPGATFDGVSGDNSGDFENQASVTATDSGAPGSFVSDNSDDPTDSDTASDDADNDPDSPTGLILSDITLTKTQVGTIVPASSNIAGNFEVTYDLAITNTGGQALNSLSLIEDLETQYGGAFVRIVPQAGAPATIVSAPVGDNPEINALYDGNTANAQIFDNTGSNTNLLDIGETVTVRIVIEIDPDAPLANLVGGTLVNQASTTGTGVLDNAMLTDLSDDPSNSDNIGAATDNNPDDPNVISIAEIELQKAVTGTPSLATSGIFGHFDIEYTFTVTNTGSETLSNLSLVDDLQTQLGGVFVRVVSVNIGAGTASNPPAANNTGPNAYDGTLGSDILAGTAADDLRPGEFFTVTLVVEVDPDSVTANYNAAGVLENSATSTGDGSNGGSASDISDDPTDAQNFQDPADAGNDPDDPTPLYIPLIGLTKAAGDAVRNGDDWDVTFTLNVENNGTVDLENLSLLDNVAAQFGNAFGSASGLTVQNFIGSGTAPGANTLWNGNNALDLLDGTGQLNIGDSFQVVFTITVDPDGLDSVSQALENQATITGDALDENGNPIDDGSGGTLQAADVSDNGFDPDSENGEDNADGTPANDPTPIIIADIGAAKSVSGQPTLLSNGNYLATYQLVVENIGTVDLANLSLNDNIRSQFGAQFVSASGLSLLTPPSNTNSTISLDTLNWNGDTVSELVDTTVPSLLAVGDFFVVEFDVEINPDAGGTATAPLENQVAASGIAIDENNIAYTDVNGATITANDDSDSGTDPSTDNSTDLGDHGTSDDPTPVYIPAIGLAKQASAATANGDNWDVDFTLFIENTGTVDLQNLSLFDNVSLQFGNAFAGASGLAIQNFAGTGTAPSVNGLWNGNNALDLLDGSGQLNVGDSFEVVFTITIDPDGLDSISQALENQAQITGEALDENGNPIDDGSGGTLQATDVSDNGTDPNGENGSEDTTDGVFANDPTPIIIADIGVAKSVFGQPTLLANGDFEAVYRLVVENTGTVDLANLSLDDDIRTQFGSQFVDAYDLALVTPPANANSTVTLLSLIHISEPTRPY